MCDHTPDDETESTTSTDADAPNHTVTAAPDADRGVPVGDAPGGADAVEADTDTDEVALRLQLTEPLLDRVDLEAGEAGTTVVEWIRGALEERVTTTDVPRRHEPRASLDVLTPGERWDDATVATDTATVRREGAGALLVDYGAGRPGEVAIRLPLPAVLVRAVARETSLGQSVTDWIEANIRVRLSMIDKSLSITVTPRVELSHAIATRARLRATDSQVLGRESADLDDWLYELVDVAPVFTLDGEPIGGQGVDTRLTPGHESDVDESEGTDE
jgi:hypothetical protein